jgi:exopolysaccharide biosynthesis polyprenyl glycosylphosphotransferase
MRHDSLYRRALLAADLVAIAGAVLLTTRVSPKSALPWTGIVLLPILIVAGHSLGLYDRDEVVIRNTTLDEAPRLFQWATFCTLTVWLTRGLMGGATLAARETLMLWLAFTFLLIAGRTGARAIARRMTPTERCLFIGDAASSQVVSAKLARSSQAGATLVAHLDLDAVGPWTSSCSSGEQLADIRRATQQLDVHRAIVAPGSTDGGDVLDLVCSLKAVGLKVSVLPRLLEVVGPAAEFDQLDGLMLMGVRRFALRGPSAITKRGCDLIGASLGLLAITPLMLAVAAAIKLDSRGPVFFRQTRVGRRGRRFQIFKFRTMVQDAEGMKESLAGRNEAQAGLFKICEDPRVTKVGRVLRKTCLDELPQLFNVLRGEMGLVGPRPLVVEEDARVEGWHRSRLEVLPGMTGRWQLLGPTRVPLGEMVAMDYLYVANWSLWTDVKILLRTVSHVLKCEGQ